MLFGNARVLFGLAAELLKQGNPALVGFQTRGVIEIPQEFKLRDRALAPGGPWMSRDENQFILPHPLLGPAQIVFGVRGLVIFVDAEERDVQVVARVREIVRIATEECRVEFGREHQAHVRVLFVFVEVVDFARVECHYVATQPGRAGAIFFDPRHGRPLRPPCLGRRHLRLRRCLDRGCDILDSNQFVQFQVRAPSLFCLGFRVEPFLNVIVAVR